MQRRGLAWKQHEQRGRGEKKKKLKEGLQRKLRERRRKKGSDRNRQKRLVREKGRELEIRKRVRRLRKRRRVRSRRKKRKKKRRQLLDLRLLTLPSFSRRLKTCHLKQHRKKRSFPWIQTCHLIYPRLRSSRMSEQTMIETFLSCFLCWKAPVTLILSRCQLNRK